MKKVLLVLTLLIGYNVYGQLSTINLGTGPNSGNGDPLRIAFGKTNSAITLLNALEIYKINTQEINILDGALVSTAELNYLVGTNNPIQAQIDGARSNFQTQLNDTVTFAEALDDNANYIQAMINASLASYGGGGGSGTSGQYSNLSGITGVTAGFPGAGDSLVIHTNFIGRYPIVFREGNFQQRHENNLSYDGYRFNTTTGTLTFRPPFAAGEQLEIWATNTILYQQLTPEGGEGGGGEPPENVLLDNLRAYWSFDEVSGTTVSDKTGTYPGVSNGSTEPYGINGYTRSYTRSRSDYSYFGATVGDMGTDDFSISLWYYRPQLIEGYLGILGNWGSVPYWYLALDEGSNNVYFQFNPSSPVNTYANSVPAASTWIHVVVTVDRSGDVTMYINGSAQTDVGDISASSAVAMDNNATFSVGRIGNHIDGYYFHGYIDDVALFRGLVLTQEQVTYLYNSGIGKFYPFN